MLIETERLRMHIASQEEMQCLVESQKDAELKTAYQD